MTDAEREAVLERLRKFAEQQHEADELADQSSLDRAADVVALYEARDWVKDLPAPKVTRNRGRPVDPESFSRFTKWLVEKETIAGRTAYQLRDAHEVRTNYLRQAQIKPEGERQLRPLKWLQRHDYSNRIPDVWKLACSLAGNSTPDAPTVRKALAEWKKDNLPKVDRKPAARGAQSLVTRWMSDAERLMHDYPELFVDAINKIEAEAERYFSREEAAA